MLILNLLVFSIIIPTVLSRNNVLLLISDDAGLESHVYGDPSLKMLNLESLAERSLIFDRAFATVSSCSPSRSAILTGLPVHQNGMYGLHSSKHHYESFSEIRSLPNLVSEKGIYTGLIGKKHVGPNSVYNFDFEQSEENNELIQIGNNITKIKERVKEFFQETQERDFFLVVSFFDSHRCGSDFLPQFGSFCEKFGNGDPEMGVIPDWTPQHFSPEEVTLPYFIPDVPEARQERAAQYTSLSRLDQGIGLVMEELEQAGYMENTLVIYTSDNGAAFPGAKNTLYDSGIRQPFLISSPIHPESHNKRSSLLSSHLDITPTVLDWFDIPYPTYYLFDKRAPVHLTGKSLLPLLHDWQSKEEGKIFASHVLHEAAMYYPMRAIRTNKYKLIHNIEFKRPFPLATDLHMSETFQITLNRSLTDQTTHWYKSLENFFYRPEWEMFDLTSDEIETANLAYNLNYTEIFSDLKERLFRWQNETSDPWRCSPSGILQDAGLFEMNHICLPYHH